ncbi:Cna B-type domain-containing protein [Streptococcus australis]|uniref:Cna B-type domain-containing protein n=1 Tax=Streptococcus australis TaxID=113107 RepID=UPI00232B9E8E|nr:Cna B-type domain-containing protein [Streptococcus australis]MDB8641974.1 LPXTG cell wall anchor domain-containing protein [Streptococcus australis]MDB8645641.1 LPXTG cell wall anchor domain-containing protein [Streptococcus australis]
MEEQVKTFYKKLFAFVAMISVVALGLSIIKPVSAATVTPTITNLKANANGQKVTFSFDWDLTGISVKEGDTFTIDAPEGVNISEIATQSLQANGAEVASVSMTNKKITFTFKKAIESMNQNVKGGFSYKAEWDNTPGNPGNKTATSNVGSESVVITRPDGPGVFESILNKYNRTGDYVSKQFKLDASENYAWMNVGDDYYLTTWFIRINGDGKKQALTNPVVSDKIQAPAVDYSKITFAPAANHAASEFFVGTYLKPSFTLRKGGQVVASGWDFWQHVKFDADGNGFTVNLSDVSDVFKTATDDEIIVEYQTIIPKTTIRVDNNATLTADEITTPQTDPAFWNNTALNFWVTGDTTVTVQKEWVGDEESDRKDITVQLYADGQALDGMTQTLTKASGWQAAFTNLPGIKDGKKIEYSVVETNTPEGYTSKVEKIDDANVIKVINTSNKPTTTTTTTTTTTSTTTTTTTTEEPTTSTTTTTEEPTTSTTTTTEEPTTSTTTTTEEPTTSTTTTNGEPTTSTTTTTGEPTTSTTTTTEEPKTTVTTTPETPATSVSTEEPSTTTTTTTTEDKGTTTTTTTSTTPEGTTPEGTTPEGTTPNGNGGGRKKLLPSTGEVVATGLVLTGVLVLAGAVVLKRKMTDN